MPTDAEIDAAENAALGVWRDATKTYRQQIKVALEAAERVRTERAGETARKIVNQALNHESAVETKISVVTLLVGIEHELGG